MVWRGGPGRLVVAGVSLLLMGACSARGSGDDGADVQSQIPSATASTVLRTPPPTAITSPPTRSMSVAEYKHALVKLLGPLESSLKRLAKAKAHKGLESRVAAVLAATSDAATDLGKITPPVQTAAQHGRLASALQTFHRDLSGVSSGVDRHQACTGAAVRAGLGGTDGTRALHRDLADLVAKLPGDGPTLTLPSSRYRGLWGTSEWEVHSGQQFERTG